MKPTQGLMKERIELLDPAKNPTLFESLVLRQENGDSVFVIAVESDERFIYGRAAAMNDTSWHMLPIENLVGIEVTLKNPKQKWFEDVKTLPQIIAKLEQEKKKKKA